MSATTQSHRKKADDIPLHITYQNVRDGVANDQANCTFGQCAASREVGMEFWINADPFDPEIFAEWTEKVKGNHLHHRGRVVRQHANGSETVQEAITIVAATDLAKKKLLRRFPKTGMDFVITEHTVRKNAAGSGVRTPAPNETDKQRKARRDAARVRAQELAANRELGLEPPARTRNRRVRARFG